MSFKSQSPLCQSQFEHLSFCCVNTFDSRRLQLDVDCNYIHSSSKEKPKRMNYITVQKKEQLNRRSHLERASFCFELHQLFFCLCCKMPWSYTLYYSAAIVFIPLINITIRMLYRFIDWSAVSRVFSLVSIPLHHDLKAFPIPFIPTRRRGARPIVMQ